MNPDTLFGDLLYHRGTLRAVRVRPGEVVQRRDIEFKGFADLLANFPASGIAVTINPDSTVRLTATGDAVSEDLWPVTTNLLRSGADIKAGVTIPAPERSNYRINPFVLGEAGFERFFYNSFGTPNDFGDLDFGSFGGDRIQLNQKILTISSNVNYGPIPIHSTTVGMALQLDLFGDPSNPGQFNEVCRYTDRELVLTPFGLCLKCTMVITPRGEFSNIDVRGNFGPYTLGGINIPAQIIWQGASPTLANNEIRFPLVLRFEGFGWGTEANPAFIGPRKPRILAQPMLAGASKVWIPGDGITTVSVPAHHPNIGDEPTGENGKDYSIISLSGEQMDRETSEVAFLTPLPPQTDYSAPQFGPQPEGPFDFPFWENPDSVHDAMVIGDRYPARRAALLAGEKSKIMVRMNGLREHYNCIANQVNRLKNAQPYNLFNHTWVRPYGSFQVTPNSISPFTDPLGQLLDKTIRPKNHFAAVSSTDSENLTVHQMYCLYRWARENGVPIKTVNDLPLIPQEIKIRNRSVTRQVTLDATCTKRTYLRTDAAYEYTFHHKYAANGSITDKLVSYGDTLRSAKMAEWGLIDGYKWIAIEDVQAAAERLGFQFCYERIVQPLSFHVTDLDFGRATQLFINANPVEFDVTRVVPITPERPNPIAKEGQTLHESWTSGFDYQGNDARFVDAVESNGFSWVGDLALGNNFTPGIAYYLIDHRAGDVITREHYCMAVDIFDDASIPKQMVAIYKLNPDFRYLRSLPSLNYWRDPNDNQQRMGAFTASVMVQRYMTEGLSPESTVILIDSNRIEHDGERFSEGSYEKAKARLQYGSQPLLPLKIVEGSGAVEMIKVREKEVFIPARPDKCQRIIFYQDWPLHLT